MAGPVIGIVTTLIMAVGGYLWLAYREKKLAAKGDVFTEPKDQKTPEKATDEKDPNWILSLVPLAIVVVLLNISGFEFEVYPEQKSW
ncbi:hypothetical protein [Oceanobacillus chungangensis]|uniref:hypothetical protein n=1 Tax=Oceanobacillus chungangensis TaxID=1229152 RepID=UPI0011C05533|nr:hypothetical protein [Oceanobacillus chungangensis]